MTSCPDCGPRPAGAYGHARWCGTLARQDWRERNPWVVLVTGSRDGVPAGVVERRIEEEVRAAVGVGYLAVVRHGAARGADRRAGALARAMGLAGWRVVEDPYPVSDAEWRASRAAGFVRNQRMVDAVPKANICLAFFAPGGSRGTADCAERARRAGIGVAPVTVGGDRMRPNYRDDEDDGCPTCLLAGRDAPALVAELGETRSQLAALRLKYEHALDADHWMRQVKQIRALMDEVLGDVPSGETTFSAVQRYVARSGPPTPP